MKFIEGFENVYSVTEDGQIYSHRNNLFLSLNSKDNGYIYCELNINGVVSYHRVHRIVAKTYVHNPENKPFVNHINGIKNDNSYLNLEWVTGTENNKHAFELGLSDNRRLWQIYKDDVLLDTFLGQDELIKKYPMSKTTIRNCVTQNRSTRTGYFIREVNENLV